VPDRGKVAGAGWIWSFTPAPAGVKDGLTSGGTRRGITASRPGNKSVLCSLQRLVSIVELRLAYLESALPPIEFLFELDALQLGFRQSAYSPLEWGNGIVRQSVPGMAGTPKSRILGGPV